MPRTPSPPRSARAAVFAGVCTGVSACGHALSSGHVIPPVALAAGFLLLFAASRTWARSERRLGPLTGWMLWGQGALHLLFTLTTRGSGHATTHGGTADLGDGGLSASMIAAHIAAGCASAWWLRQGERGFFDLLGFVGVLLAGVLVVVRPLPAPALPTGGTRFAAVDERPPRPFLLRHVHVRRGPPRSL
ncbi:hypothetical protein [Nocardiopsis lambiniae]|uniref:MFS transporter n=1 Tax=Nocardiopsis lambiniae TaxID=3075539 RepID=A0ABU2M7X9_9ACTN|nr:hypothetical protein [Nocardiopsis sp. DSM 44743]MDT0328346.1 hypothetical protein [Nocardiopsis sp. DSM 44743]